jgi:hypothetical protein
MRASSAAEDGGSHNSLRSTARPYSPLLWLSVTCLDAPMVAVSWQWLLARTFEAQLHLADRAALFFTAWMIYLADRVADSLTVSSHGPKSARQSFCLKHRRSMFVAITVIAPVAAIAVWRGVDRKTFLMGAIIGLAIGVYLIINHLAAFVWRVIPLKEVSIGFLFALGTVAAIHVSRPSFFAGALLFAMLCSLNCLSISVWERSLDLGQGRVSFAVSHSRWNQLPEIVSSCLGLSGALLTMNSTLRWLGICLAISATGLVVLNRLDGVQRDVRVAWADLVLLTPLIFLCSGRL